MSTQPNNHHYVSQCLLKKFFNISNTKTFIYDKGKNNYFYRQGTKKLLSEDFLNTTLDENQLSNKLEHDLDKYFEKGFNSHYENVLKFLNKPEINIKNSIEYLIRLGIIGEIRNKEYKKETDNTIIGIFKMLSKHAAPELKQNIENGLSALDKLEYKTSVDFVNFANKVLLAIGEWKFSIFYVEKDLFFLLPDCTSIINRHRINDYFNPEAIDIAEIGMPIDNHTYIRLNSTKVKDGINRELIKLNKKELLDINRFAYIRARKQIVCGDMDFLKDTVNKITSP